MSGFGVWNGSKYRSTKGFVPELGQGTGSLYKVSAVA